jgi:NTP pyrophosphatase (non-canonical NTP hydrolase)
VEQRWCGFQESIATWKQGIMPPHENTPEREFDRSTEEFDELAAAVKSSDGSPTARQEIQEEAADVIIRMIGLITAAGGNVADLVEKKIEVIQDKYPVAPIRGQLQEGVPFHVAMAVQKQKWQQRQTPR